MNKIISALLLCLWCTAASASVFTWTGNAGTSDWFTSGNWSVDDVAATTYPQADDDVIIPRGKSLYPVLRQSATQSPACHFIYFDIVYTNGALTENSARVKNQHLLTYTEAFCDVSVTANRWVRTAAPLKNTFSGDYFVQHQTLDQRAWGGSEYDAQGVVVNGPATDWHFVEAEYKYSQKGENASNENLYVNRSKKGTYYSYYSSNQIVKSNLGNDSTSTFMQQWGDPSNSLAARIMPAMGFDVWVNYGTAHKNDAVTFRFPTATGWYAYFEDGGHISPRAGESLKRDAAHAQGKFALDKADVDEQGKVTFTVTREGSGVHSKMWAVGNPAIAYLDIARFIHKNVDLNHIYRYVYTHNEDYASRGTENIYFYSRRSGDKLYKLQTQVAETDNLATGNTNPNGPTATKTEVSKATRSSFINPAEGFRVFGGGVSYKCVVPDLVGIYSSARVVIAPDVCKKYYNNGSLITGSNAYSSSEIPMLQRGYVDFVYSVTVTGDPNKVRINNFLNLGSVEATINTTNQTLTIPAGSKIMAVLGGDGKCDGNSNKDLWNFTESGSTYDMSASDYNLTYSGAKVRVLNIYGLNDDSWEFASSKLQVYSGVYANNITNTVSTASANDIILKYTIDEDGAIHIDMNPSNCKKILVRSEAVSNSSSNKPAYHHDSTYPESRLCEAWFAYEGMTSSKPADNGTAFIMQDMNMEGSYKTKTSTKSSGYGNVGTEKWNSTMEIARIAGRSDVVTIKGLYPDDKTTPALGQIERRTTVSFTRSNFSNATPSVATVGAISISLSGGRGNNNGYVPVATNNTITVSGATIKRMVLTTTNNSDRRGTWTESTGMAELGYQKVIWQGNATSVILTNISSNTARVSKIEVLYSDANGAEYYMSVPAGQLVHMAGMTAAPETDFYFYAHGNASTRMRTIEMLWHTSGATDNSSQGYWEQISESDNKACKGAMVTRCGLQPDMSNLSGNYGAILGGEYYTGYDADGGSNKRHHCKFHRMNASATSDSWDAVEIFTPGSSATAGQIDLTFTPDMFQANMADANSEAALAPARVAASANSAPVFITAMTVDSMMANTMIEVDPEANDEFNPMEDAPLFDVADYSFSFGTLAGSYLVAVNSVASAELILLYMSQSATVTFENIVTLGEAYLYDAVEDTRVLISDNTPYALEIAEGQQAGRYFIQTDIGVAADVDNVDAVVCSWTPVAYCPADGVLAVACAEEGVSFEVFNVSGQKVAQSAESATFIGLPSGLYVVSASRGSENQTLKVIVY